MPAYLIAEHIITDAAKFEEYRTKVGPMITKYGGRYLTKGGSHKLPEDGHWKPERVVIIEFPDMDSLVCWTARPNTSRSLPYAKPAPAIWTCCLLSKASRVSCSRISRPCRNSVASHGGWNLTSASSRRLQAYRLQCPRRIAPRPRLKRDVPLTLMRRLSALIVLIALGAGAHGQTFPEPRTLRINERVYVLLGPIQHANRFNQGYMINSTVIVGDKGVILVDSGGSDEVGRHIATAVRRSRRNRSQHGEDDHHGDYYLGNVAFEGAAFISSEMCRVPVLETGT